MIIGLLFSRSLPSWRQTERFVGMLGDALGGSLVGEGGEEDEEGEGEYATDGKEI